MPKAPAVCQSQEMEVGFQFCIQDANAELRSSGIAAAWCVGNVVCVQDFCQHSDQQQLQDANHSARSPSLRPHTTILPTNVAITSQHPMSLYSKSFFSADLQNIALPPKLVYRPYRRSRWWAMRRRHSGVWRTMMSSLRGDAWTMPAARVQIGCSCVTCARSMQQNRPRWRCTTFAWASGREKGVRWSFAPWHECMTSWLWQQVHCQGMLVFQSLLVDLR